MLEVLYDYHYSKFDVARISRVAKAAKNVEFSFVCESVTLVKNGL